MIGIIGAGISGLSLAWHLQQKNVPYQVFEASGRAGGCIRTRKENGYLMEEGPNSILADQQAKEFIKAAGLGDRILPPEPVSKHRFIFKNGAYQKLPSSPPALLMSSFFSLGTIWKIFREPSNKTRSTPGETVGAFFERRFGKEIVELAVNPFVSGIYAGDPYQLQMDKTFPMLAEYEQKFGSVINGFIKNRKNAERKESFSFVEGMQELPAALARKVSIRYNAPVKAVEPLEQGGFRLQLPDGEQDVTQLVLALPAFKAAELLANFFPEVAASFNSVYYPPMATVHSVFKKETMQHPLDGFGGLNPKQSGLFTAGSIWSSSLFPNRCPASERLVTSFVGGVQYAKNTRLPDEEIMGKVAAEQQKLYGSSMPPLKQALYRWEKAIPQYNKNIGRVWEQASILKTKGIHICANWSGGVSVADCIRKGKALSVELEQQRQA